jgi:hypothetical protein
MKTLFPPNGLILPINVLLLQYCYLYLKVRLEVIKYQAGSIAFAGKISYRELEDTRAKLSKALDNLGYSNVIIDREYIVFNSGNSNFKINAHTFPKVKISKGK